MPSLALKLTLKEQKALEEFKTELQKKFGSRLVLLKLFGSKARGDFHQESDLDILVVVRHPAKNDKDFISELTYNLLLKYSVYISPRTFSEKKWVYYLSLPMSLAYNIEKEGINLWQSSKPVKLN